jgi:hypothetical protein
MMGDKSKMQKHYIPMLNDFLRIGHFVNDFKFPGAFGFAVRMKKKSSCMTLDYVRK